MGSIEPGITSVVINELHACYLATRHLVKFGHVRIGFLGWLETATTCFRLAGYHRAYFDANLPLLTRYEERRKTMPGIVPTFDFRLIRPIGHDPLATANTFVDTSRVNMLQWLDEDFADLGCTALVLQNDQCALGVVAALTQRGYSVPGDISVIGFDNERFCANENPALSSVGANMYDLGTTAVEVVLKAIDGEQKPPTITMIEPSLFARESTGPAPGTSKLTSS